jgi:hypothetical protein
MSKEHCGGYLSGLLFKLASWYDRGIFVLMSKPTEKRARNQYSIDTTHGLIHKKHSGEVTVDDEIKLLDQIISDPTFHKGMNALCDFTNATASWSLEDLDRFRAYVTRIKKVTGRCKWAILFPAGSDTSTARMFVALNDAFEDTISAKLFSDSKEALAWLQSAVDEPK